MSSAVAEVTLMKRFGALLASKKAAILFGISAGLGSFAGTRLSDSVFGSILFVAPITLAWIWGIYSFFTYYANARSSSSQERYLSANTTPGGIAVWAAMVCLVLAGLLTGGSQ